MPATPQTRSIDTSITINAPASAVWNALTTAEGLTNWFPLEARVIPGPGGRIWSSWGSDFQGECAIDVWEPNKRLRVVYPQLSTTAEVDASSAELAATDYLLQSQSGATVLRLVHSGFSAGAEWDDLYDATSRGWSFELRGLRHYLERHPRSKRHVIRSTSVFDLPLDEAWRRLTSADGLVRTGGFPSAEEGATFAITPFTGERLTGRVQIVKPPGQLALVVAEWNDALLRFHFDEWRHPQPRKNAYMWISLYDVPESDRRVIEEAWAPLLPRLLR